MRRFFSVGIYLTLLLVSCAPQPASVPTSIPTPTKESPAPVTHAPEIRFALIGDLPASHTNVWELFDESGATYTDYALRSEYWPRLYHLAPIDSSFQPYAADGFPSEVTQEGDKYFSLVKLRSDLKWTDGSPFTSEDVAFTVNTALTFELGYDWASSYPRKYLDHVEAADASTVKFVFKQKPNVGVWQYGALQGPVVQKAFWESNVNDAARLLPDEKLRSDINEKRASLETAQSDLANLTAQVIALNGTGQQSRKLEGDYTRMQGEVLYLQGNLDKLLEGYIAQIKLAQEALYALSDNGEPTLGAWTFDSAKDDVWINKANPEFPFGTPNFDRATYRFFKDEAAALTAFQNKEVDFILSPDGISAQSVDAEYSPSYSARFLVFNPSRSQFADPPFRSALDCMIDRKVLATENLQNQVTPLDTFVLSPQWHDSKIKDACVDLDRSARVEYAVKLLKDAGYSWMQEPTPLDAGQKLLMSNGEAFPKLVLLAPTKEEDALRYTAAKYIAEQAQHLGILLSVQEMSLDDIVYAVYSSQKYDAALMGWRLSEYPAYLCEWFGGGNMYLYNSGRFRSMCEALRVETKLDAAQPAVAQIESSLMTELPFIPLFTVTRADVYRNLSYPVPAANILNGWGGYYGAPSYAIPAP